MARVFAKKRAEPVAPIPPRLCLRIFAANVGRDNQVPTVLAMTRLEGSTFTPGPIVEEIATRWM